MKPLPKTEVDQLIHSQNIDGLMKLARDYGLLGRSIDVALAIQPPSMLMSVDLVLLGRVYGMLLREAPQRLGLEAGIESIQRYSVLLVEEELTIARKLFEWPSVLEGDFLAGVRQVSEAVHFDLMRTVTSFRTRVLQRRNKLSD